MPPHAHIHITRTSRIAVAKATTCHRAAAHAVQCGPDAIGAPFIIQPTAVAHAWSQTEWLQQAPGKMPLMASVANAKNAP